MSLVDFLLARIAEDEELGRDPYLTQLPAGRWAAECEAKRAIIEAHRKQVDEDDDCAWIVRSEVLLIALAQPYADHPDFDPAWT